MTIDGQIRDEKLQYDINRKAAKISALSSNKIGKYEYLTGEEISPYNQKQIIEQAKFTYSPVGKAFEKKKKNNWRSRKKTNEGLKALKLEEQTKAIEDKSNGKLSIQKEVYNKVLDKRTDDIREIAKEIDYNKLIYYFKGPYIATINFLNIKVHFIFLKK